MEIIEIYNKFFDRKGFILDDGYNLYKLKRYIQYYTENNIDYISCQDIDLDNLLEFKQLKYLSIPDEAFHISGISKLIELRGIELGVHQLRSISENIIKNLESLILYCGNERIDCLRDFCNLKKMKIDGFPGANNADLSFIQGLNLQHLSITSRKIKSLNGIQFENDLRRLEISSCSGLIDISGLAELQKLKEFRLFECNKLDDIQFMYLPQNIEYLSIMGSESMCSKLSFSSFDFLEKMKNLKEFATNWNVRKEHLKNIKELIPTECKLTFLTE